MSSLAKVIGGGVLAAGAGGLAYPQLVLSHGPVGYWRMDEDTAVGDDVLRDSSGSGYHMNGPPIATNILSGQTSLLAQDGGTCHDLPGTNSETFRRQFADNDHPFAPANMLATGFTFECWFNRASAATSMTILAYDTKNASGDEMSVRFLSSSGGRIVQFMCEVGGTTYSKNGPSSIFTDGTTYHLVWTMAAGGGTIELWVDGVKQTVSSNPGIAVAGTRQLEIGAWGAGDAFMYDGRLDEVACYAHVLTDAQIVAHYNAGS